MNRGLLLLAAMPLLAACGGEVDIATVEDEVAAGIEDQIGEPVTVDCPDQVDWRAGEEFHCFAEDAAGQKARVTVSMENDDGEWSWVLG